MLMSVLYVPRGLCYHAVDRAGYFSAVVGWARAQGVSDPGTIDIVHGILQPAGIKKLLVPANFSYAYALRLQQLGYQLELKTGPLFPARAIKTAEEVRQVEAAQRATERAVAAAHAALRTAEIRHGVIWLNGEPVTSEWIKKLINVQLMESDCVAQHTIVAGGDQACDPHNEGTGPLPADRSIIFDVFPRSAQSRYFADMSRTVVKGRPSAELKKLYQIVKDTQEEAITKIHDGADGAKIHQGICDRFEAAGYRTGVVNGRMQGYFHGTGHGVGLDIHEAPRISKTGSLLQEGHIVTVEPGLYYPGLGAIRIEDMVLVTKDGCRNLTNFPKVFELDE
jgi:Xaa-Pro aminopeptidase